MWHSTIMVIVIISGCEFRVLGAGGIIYMRDITCDWSKGWSVVFTPQNTTPWFWGSNNKCICTLL